MTWTLDQMPSLAGQTWVVTGANSGLGLETVRGLASKGARVVMACRDVTKAEVAAAQVKTDLPDAQLELERLDLASLQSIEAFAARLHTTHPVLDGLVNNAGLMAIPRAETADGFELQFGTNHLGHFALTLRLLPLLEAAKAARVVTIASTAHRMGTLRFDDLMGQRSYSAWGAYGQSKLANLLFTFELARKLAAAGKKTIAVAAHPGYSATNLMATHAQAHGSALTEWIMNLGNVLLAQSSAQGALPTLYAASMGDVKSGEYFGPDGLLELAGAPRRRGSNAKSKDLATAQKLWEISEHLTAVKWPG